MAEMLLILTAIVLVPALIFLIFSIVGDMAVARGHSPWPWWLLSLAWSPFATMIIMWLFFSVQDEDELE